MNNNRLFLSVLQCCVEQTYGNEIKPQTTLTSFFLWWINQCNDIISKLNQTVCSSPAKFVATKKKDWERLKSESKVLYASNFIGYYINQYMNCYIKKTLSGQCGFTSRFLSQLQCNGKNFKSNHHRKKGNFLKLLLCISAQEIMEGPTERTDRGRLPPINSRSDTHLSWE